MAPDLDVPAGAAALELIQQLEQQLRARDRTIAALSARTEGVMARRGTALSVFEANLTLEEIVADRTREAREQGGKPCDPDELVRALHDAVRQRHLILAERELLEQTLSGAVRAMSEMLALLAPEIFRRSSALARAASHVATKLQLEPRWALEIAARLSMVGAVALPPELLERERGGEQLTDVERAQIAAHPETGHRLLSNIPRLESVALMVRHQRHENLLTANLPRETAIGARVLRVLLALDAHARHGAPFAQARQTLRKSASGDEAAILDALTDYAPLDDGPTTRRLVVKQLVVGMVLATDVLGRNGAVVLSKGTEVTDVVRERLLNFARGVGVLEPLTVLVPR
jgi:hypothetical protein